MSSRHFLVVNALYFANNQTLKVIIGIGNDIVDHNQTRLLNWETNDTLLVRLLSYKELELLENYPANRLRFIAGRFAAKEAVLKCLGTGIEDGIKLIDIQILQSIKGTPIVKLEGAAMTLSNRKQINSWHLSITHSPSHSFAFAIAEKH